MSKFLGHLTNFPSASKSSLSLCLFFIPTSWRLFSEDFLIHKKKKKHWCQATLKRTLLFYCFISLMLVLFVYLFLATLHDRWDLRSWPGIQPVPPALEVQSLNYWIARKSPRSGSFWRWKYHRHEAIDHMRFFYL